MVLGDVEGKVKERPILFSGAMVRAILDGRKTQTRRMVKPQPAPFVQHTPDRHPTNRTEPYIDAYCGERKTAENPRGMGMNWYWWTADNRLSSYVARCPYGQPGDRLWVRETWQQFFDDEMPASRPRGPIGTMGCPATPDRKSRVFYRADGDSHPSDQFGAPTWCPSIHMPRWASRITLEISDVRVERLQVISEAAAKAEGIEGSAGEYWCPDHGPHHDAVSAYRELWGLINGPCSWAANPWVWVIEFRRVEL